MNTLKLFAGHAVEELGTIFVSFSEGTLELTLQIVWQKEMAMWNRMVQARTGAYCV